MHLLFTQVYFLFWHSGRVGGQYTTRIHNKIWYSDLHSPIQTSVGWECRIHRLLLGRGVRPPPQRLSWIWYETIWWWGPSGAGALGNAEYSFIAIAPRFTLARSGSTRYGPIYGSSRTNCILMLNWIVWIKTVWPNLIVWNRNVFDN